MEEGVPRVEEPDSKPKNFHLSIQAAERAMETLSQTLRKHQCTAEMQREKTEIPLCC